MSEAENRDAGKQMLAKFSSPLKSLIAKSNPIELFQLASHINI